MCECMYAMRQLESKSQRSWIILFTYMHIHIPNKKTDEQYPQFISLWRTFEKLFGTTQNDLLS